MRTVRGLWRWRDNPLRRATDLAEACAGLAAALLILCLAPAVGWLTGMIAHDALNDAVREQRARRHEVTATVVTVLAQPPVDPDPETSSARDAHRRVLARWTGPDGKTRTGTVHAPASEAGPGDRIPLWTDEHGSPVGRPLDSATATTHAVFAGVGAAALAAGLVEGARRLVVWRLTHRRYARWDSAWERAGQDWGRAGAGS
ncbi:hypothetical protein [Streptomyces sp. XD-27]|uniref:Rv1733c family protein n=1 Tax=Streptomyces sp. XD-27 TaxID=3062779 RepID=UPI0026F44005|nr:hypothetical protein [Streptomyces sp. XD-27]WKX73639.1 hypothetical protein Q3Y56_30455 [Streptomyces sp. XD-27]